MKMLKPLPRTVARHCNSFFTLPLYSRRALMTVPKTEEPETRSIAFDLPKPQRADKPPIPRKPNRYQQPRPRDRPHAGKPLSQIQASLDKQAAQKHKEALERDNNWKRRTAKQAAHASQQIRDITADLEAEKREDALSATERKDLVLLRQAWQSRLSDLENALSVADGVSVILATDAEAVAGQATDFPPVRLLSLEELAQRRADNKRLYAHERLIKTKSQLVQLVKQMESRRSSDLPIAEHKPQDARRAQLETRIKKYEETLRVVNELEIAVDSGG